MIPENRMQSRRFGRTNLSMPVFSFGCMRFQQAWNEAEPVAAGNQRNLEAIAAHALEVGINHFETARAYGTSEKQLGDVLPRLPRERMIVQTKVVPDADPQKFLAAFELSMDRLKLEYVDLLAIHGLNNHELVQEAIRPGGCLDVVEKLKAQGRVRHAGFSTHATGGRYDFVLEAIESGRFDFVNLHWFYVYPFNWPAIEAATRRDMGVFIISPADKGGKLYEPSAKFEELTAPLSPMVFNAWWCLARPEVHTLSIGARKPADLDEHLKTLEHLNGKQDLLVKIEARLQAELHRAVGAEWAETWHVGLPLWYDVPGEINLFEILRLYNLAKAFDLLEYGKMRYNLLRGNAGHWFPGKKADKLDGVDLKPCLARSPHAKVIPEILAEAHAMLSGPEVQRLGKH